MINIIGCYIRLSQADNKSDESNSVVNQRMLIHNYINAHTKRAISANTMLRMGIGSLRKNGWSFQMHILHI